MTRTIAFEMTWESSLPLLLVVLENGTAEGVKMAREELRRMAKVADMARAPEPAPDACPACQVWNDGESHAPGCPHAANPG